VKIGVAGYGTVGKAVVYGFRLKGYRAYVSDVILRNREV
jgi:hypothetical protein